MTRDSYMVVDADVSVKQYQAACLRSVVRHVALACSLAFILFLGVACGYGGGNESSVRTEERSDTCGTDADSLKIVLTGDLLLDRGVRPVVERHGMEWLLDSVSPMFKAADAVLVNLECPLTDVVTPQPKQFVFRGDVAWAEGLRKAGITHASMANNHSMDQGFQGVESTYKSLKSAGIEPMGCGRNVKERLTPVLIKKGNLCVAVFSDVLFPI
ncbi:MAG: CapA family protein, partial [Bacteroidaceae bacterium]|nr:CapA family protein [Bacteroidaceae bacterium]